ncbi:inorganic phosphate transporter [Pseudogulbenkiania subflava]|uniref:Phosphate transporter n=1 Tax=Pseudogulbenkiania subflava DSM 22618 TaxID=1123014 RepID=A0A1Y6BXM5_9NEIS|nr:inorganic phosphate transporter [Pseudogulbenkiania subflava]SMF23295.1 inorganic phosphate transporter, PiT family [Pseudogulbenkiania subflava DSM 22618]SMF32647.1 inorganic phosphate transporter, PiT family [Pseudogulbenkiania subflava DSM 22618]SMF47690.1 inorganic phosphate transporter, PiT family [Pseudogulbenkiania subflava DSM 22618]
MEYLLIGAALLVAFSNGANDNFKGFATVWGSDTLSYRSALILATVATVAGSAVSLLLADTLVQQFSGKGLVPDAVASAPLFLASVGAGTALTVFIATRAGLPISTTHALIGGLIGAALGQHGGEIHYAKLAGSFLLPLVTSPLIAAALGLVIYPLARRRAMQNHCACVLPPVSLAEPAENGAVLMQAAAPGLIIAPQAQCDTLPQPMARFSLARLADQVHTLSGALICFARGVNDTPKLAALLLASHLFQASVSVLAIAAIMAAGGLLYARRVAVTMSQRVTRMDSAQGLTANLITAALVLLASKLGLPVSTTHVAVGAIAGVGAGARSIDWSTVNNIVLSWLATLPLAAVLAWLATLAVRTL